ncbi:hypothetical protein HDU97_010412 [Phlyctochytrium planicorne]|nr:hypothetical protein HDU97_010412 [Phlyctochytrium planicorne]
MIKLLVLAASLAQIVLSTPSVFVTRDEPKIVFDQKDLVIDDTMMGAEIAVSLASAPSSVATLYLEASGLKISSCSLKFTADNYKIPQKVRLIGGGSDKTTAYTLSAQVYAPNSDVHLAKESVAITRKAYPAAYCYSSGDPHFKTFDGKYYSAQGQGVFYLIKSPSLVVQVDQQPCNTDVTCNRAVAIQYGASVISLTGSTTSGAATMTMNMISDKVDGLTATANAAKDTYQVTATDGTLITVSIYGWNGVYYMDAGVNAAASQYGKTDGLCGNYNQNDGDDVANPDAWTVPASENIFYQGKGLSLTVPVPPIVAICKMPDLGVAPTTDGSCPVTNPIGFTSITLSIPSASVVTDYIASSISYANSKILSTIAAAKIPTNLAATFCASLRTLDSFCTTAIDVNYFVGACTADLSNTGDMSILTNAQKNLLSACAAKATADAGFCQDKNEADQLFGKANELFSKIKGAASSAISSAANVQLNMGPLFNAPPAIQMPAFNFNF